MISMFVFVMDHSLRVVVIAIVIFTYIGICAGDLCEHASCVSSDETIHTL